MSPAAANNFQSPNCLTSEKMITGRATINAYVAASGVKKTSAERTSPAFGDRMAFDIRNMADSMRATVTNTEQR